MSGYIANLKGIFNDLLMPYKNFLHWNISKAVVFLYSNILGLILSLPFAGVVAYQYFSSYRTLGITPNIETFILGNIGAIVLTAVLLVCIVIIFICTYTYGNFLMMNVYKSYLEGEKLAYAKNLYFSGKHFRAYMGILGWISLYMLAPIALGAVLIVPLGMLAKAATGAFTVVLAIVSFVLFAALLAWFVSLIIRLSFSYYGLVYSENIEKARVYVQEWLRITKGKVWKVIFLGLPFLVLLGIVGGISQTAEQKLLEGRVYTTLVDIQKQSGQDDHKLLEGFFIGQGLFPDIEKDKEDFKAIEAAFEPMKNDVNKTFLSASLKYIDVKFLDKNGWMFTAVFVLFSFLALEGLTSMLYISIYHAIKPKEGDAASV